MREAIDRVNVLISTLYEINKLEIQIPSIDRLDNNLFQTSFVNILFFAETNKIINSQHVSKNNYNLNSSLEILDQKNKG